MQGICVCNSTFQQRGQTASCKTTKHLAKEKGHLKNTKYYLLFVCKNKQTMKKKEQA